MPGPHTAQLPFSIHRLPHSHPSLARPALDRSHRPILSRPLGSMTTSLFRLPWWLPRTIIPAPRTRIRLGRAPRLDMQQCHLASTVVKRRAEAVPSVMGLLVTQGRVDQQARHIQLLFCLDLLQSVKKKAHTPVLQAAAAQIPVVRPP